MNTLDKVLAVAINEKGYLEKKSASDLDDKTANAGYKNYTKYWRDLDSNMQGEPWCQAFVDWCFMKAYGTAAGKKLLNMTAWSYYTPTAAGYFKAKSQWHTSPQAGDIIYFKNSTRICHVGIVKAVNGSTVTTIEGNTSTDAGVVPNGGGVFEKSYQLTNSRIAGYGRPAYDTEAAKTGWVQSGDKWYYRTSPGVNAHGWLKIRNADGKTRWYHFKDNGEMDTDWQEIDSKWYYFQPSGDLAGAMYVSDSDGAQSICVIE